MRLIQTYKAIINHNLCFPKRKDSAKIEQGNMKRIKLFIFPLLDQLEVGKEIPEELKTLMYKNGEYINLSYTYMGDTYRLYIVTENGKFKYASQRGTDEDQSHEDAFGYCDFMAILD